MVILGVIWFFAAIFVALFTIAAVFAGGPITAILLVVALRAAWLLAKKDWGIGSYAPQPAKRSRPTYAQLRAKVRQLDAQKTNVATALDAPDFGIDPDAMP